MPESTIDLDIKNFPAQQSIFDAPAKFKIVPKGRRFGLTKGAANDYITGALKGTFKRGIWVDTINSNIDRYIERMFLPKLKKLPTKWYPWDWRQQAKVLQIKDSYIDFRSVDKPENIEGFGYDKFFLNEAGIILKDTYLWDNAIRPMLWDGDARGVIGGTPKGKGKFFELAERARTDQTGRYQYFHFTSFDNPYLPQEVIKEDMADMPELVVRQEIYAEFLEDTGVVFREVLAVATAVPESPQPGHYYVIGCDLAKIRDYTVLAVYDRGSNKQVYQARFNKLDWPSQIARIRETSKHFNNAPLVLESNGPGEPVADDLGRQGVPIEPIKQTSDLKRQMVEKLANWIELRRLRIINIPETIKELTDFTYDISEKTGRIRYEAPSGLHDDIVMAHALAVWSLSPLTRKPIPEVKPLIAATFEKRLKEQEGNYGQEISIPAEYFTP